MCPGRKVVNAMNAWGRIADLANLSTELAD
jgi:hypothetical protein